MSDQDRPSTEVLPGFWLRRAIPTQDAQEALAYCRDLAALQARMPAAPASKARPRISVVIPIFNEEGNLPLLFDRLTQVMDAKEPDCEFVFVNDGSRDRSLGILAELAQRDRRVAVVDLARNFGHQVAISAGLDYARGQAVIVMDGDLQDPPEVLPAFIDKWVEGYDVVYAIREHRKEPVFKRAAYFAFYRLLQSVADIEIPLDAGDFCIMDRRVVDILTGMPERNRFVRGIRSWIGLKQTGLAYERQARNAGRPKFTFTHLLYLALDGLISFSVLPLRAISVLGFMVSVVSILFAGYYIVQRLTAGLSPPGFATIVVAIFFLSGTQLITLGVIGEYVGRIFAEVKRRPLYIVRRVTRAED